MNTISSELDEINDNINIFAAYMKNFPEKALALGIRIILALLIFFIGSKIIAFVRKVLKKSLARTKAEASVVTFLDGVVKFGLYFILIIIIAGNFGVDATSIIALLGSIGVTIGLALQGSLSNLAGGVLIMVLKPFKVGDYIHDNSSDTEGYVKSISIFYTTLISIDQKTIILPNGNLSNASVINFSTSPTRQVDINMSIAYSADIKKAKEVLNNVIQKQPTVLKNMEVTIFVASLGSSEVNIETRCYCNNQDYWTTKWALTENMKLALDEAGIEIPFPQMDVHMRA